MFPYINDILYRYEDEFYLEYGLATSLKHFTSKISVWEIESSLQSPIKVEACARLFDIHRVWSRV